MKETNCTENTTAREGKNTPNDDLFTTIWELCRLHLAQDLLDMAIYDAPGAGLSEEDAGGTAYVMRLISAEGRKESEGKTVFEKETGTLLQQYREALWSRITDADFLEIMEELRKDCAAISDVKQAIDRDDKVTYRHGLRLFETEKQHREDLALYDGILKNYDTQHGLVAALRGKLEDLAELLMQQGLTAEEGEEEEEAGTEDD